MFTKIASWVTPMIGAKAKRLGKWAPEAYLGAGIAAGITATVLLMKAHKKSEDVFEEDLGVLHEVNESFYDDENVTYTSREKVQYTLPIYRTMAVDAVKLYGPGLLLGGASIALILASHGAQKRRIGELVSLVVVMERGFNTYRERVIEEMGQEADDRFFTGAVRQRVSEMYEKDGKMKKKKVDRNVMPEQMDPIMYSRTFDHTNPKYGTHDLNVMCLEMAEAHLNNKLEWRGWVTLNEAYQELGFQEVGYGAFVGWAKDAPGDDYVDLGIYSDINRRDGQPDKWFINPNVNGPIVEWLI